MVQINDVLISIILLMVIIILAWLLLKKVQHKLPGNYCLNMTQRKDSVSERAIINMDHEAQVGFSSEIIQPEIKEPNDGSVPAYNDSLYKLKIHRRLFEGDMSNQVDSADEMSFIYDGYSETETAQVRKAKDITTRFGKYLENVPGIEPMILVSLHYNMIEENLVLAIIKVANLKLLSNNRKPDAYARVDVWVGSTVKLKKKTVVVKQELNPVYNQKMEFHVPCEDLESVKIVVTIANVTPGASPRNGPELLHTAVFGGQFVESFLEHWKTAITTNKPIAKWHLL